MGDNLVKFYNERIKKEWKITFISTMIIGLLTHIYKFTNILPNHDTIWNIYSDQNMIVSGRWFLSIACGFSSYLDLPWVNGLLSLIYIALTAVIIVDLFKISKPVPCILIGGLLVTFPAVTTTFFFEFTADGYMLAMLMSALAIYLLSLEKRKILFSAISIVLLCLSCGIYQAYIPFALMLVICNFIIKLIDNELSNKEYFIYIVKHILVFLVSLALYYVVWKLLMIVQGVAPTNYQGINNLGEEMYITKGGFVEIIVEFIDFFTKESVTDLYTWLNIILLIFLVVVVVITIIKKAIIKRKVQLLLLVLSFIIIPFSIYCWKLVSFKVEYYTIMLQSIAMVYILFLILSEKYINLKFKNCVAVLLSIIIINFSIMANKAYVIMDFNDKANYALGVKIATRVEQEMTSKDMKVAIVGGLLSHEHDVSKIEEMNLFCYNDSDLYGGIMYKVDIRTEKYLEGFVGVNYNWVSDRALKDIVKDEEVKNMPVWPLDGSVKAMGDTVVVKLSEVE